VALYEETIPPMKRPGKQRNVSHAKEYDGRCEEVTKENRDLNKSAEEVGSSWKGWCKFKALKVSRTKTEKGTRSWRFRTRRARHRQTSVKWMPRR
jgi:hypothetical protein